MLVSYLPCFVSVFLCVKAISAQPSITDVYTINLFGGIVPFDSAAQTRGHRTKARPEHVYINFFLSFMTVSLLQSNNIEDLFPSPWCHLELEGVAV